MAIHSTVFVYPPKILVGSRSNMPVDAAGLQIYSAKVLIWPNSRSVDFAAF